MGDDRALRRARFQEGDTAELHGSGAAIDFDFVGEGRAAHRYYTSNKTRPLLARRATEGVDRSGRRTSQLELHRRGPVVRLVESRGIPTERRLLTCPLDTVAVVQKDPLRRCRLYLEARRLEAIKIGGASMAAGGRGRGVAGFAESCAETLNRATAAAGAQRRGQLCIRWYIRGRKLASAKTLPHVSKKCD